MGVRVQIPQRQGALLTECPQSGPFQSTAFRGVGKRMSCAKTGEPSILTTYTSYDAFLHKEMPFGGRDVIAPHLGVKSTFGA